MQAIRFPYPDTTAIQLRNMCSDSTGILVVKDVCGYFFCTVCIYNQWIIPISHKDIKPFLDFFRIIRVLPWISVDASLPIILNVTKMSYFWTGLQNPGVAVI